MRINRISSSFGSSFHPYVNGVRKTGKIPGSGVEEKKDPKSDQKDGSKKSGRDEYIHSDADGSVLSRNYNDLGYLMRQAENSARFDNFNTDEP